VSLGPPFDASGVGLQQRVGAAVVLALALAVGWVLTLSGRSVGRGVTFFVEMRTPGPLREAAKVRLAGREIGEVRQIAAGRGGVVLETFVAGDWASQVRDGSDFFVTTPSVLGEAYLEIGPGRGGAPVAAGHHVRGADPAEIDNFLAHTEANLRQILALLRDERPALDELLIAADALLATLSGLPADGGQLRRIRDQAMAAIDAGARLVGALRDAGGLARARAAARELSAVIDRAAPELRGLAERADAAATRIDELGALFAPARRAQLAAALASLRRAAALGEATVRDTRWLVDHVQRGRGAIGAFLQDRELFDDLHETHRILKSQPWTLILKPVR
jgi:ABC-type transporter Mla subunit MlaD